MEYELSKCPICGDTKPPLNKLCWCCEHKTSLHPTDPKPADRPIKKAGDSHAHEQYGTHSNH